MYFEDLNFGIKLVVLSVLLLLNTLRSSFSYLGASVPTPFSAVCFFNLIVLGKLETLHETSVVDSVYFAISPCLPSPSLLPSLTLYTLVTVDVKFQLLNGPWKRNCPWCQCSIMLPSISPLPTPPRPTPLHLPYALVTLVPPHNLLDHACQPCCLYLDFPPYLKLAPA